jgi:SpoVK/Ycf46/Vps4 family AAA+-type ATPase
MSDDLSELFAKIAGEAKRADHPGTAVLLRGAESAAAAVSIARLAQRSLYRVDLNAVTSKYIAETEKNLDTVFDTAERKRAVLFFDETDALSGKRSDVGSAHDRSVNHVVYLLVQRIAKFPGVVALATAEGSVIHPALQDILRYEIRLPDL